jgi:hypothetical protein
MSNPVETQLRMSEQPQIFYPDKRPDCELTFTNQPPIANLILSRHPVNQHEFREIEQTAMHLYWPHIMVLTSRYYGDASGLVLKAVGKFDNPQDVHTYINDVCWDQFDKLESRLKPQVLSLLKEEVPHDILNSALALNNLVVGVNTELDRAMTDEGIRIRSLNAVSFNEQTYSTDTMSRALAASRRSDKWFLVPHYHIFPDAYENNLIVSIKQQYSLFEMPEISQKLIRQLTPPEYSSAIQDTNDPNNSDFLPRRLLRFGNPPAVATLSIIAEKHGFQNPLRYAPYRLKKPVIHAGGLH